EILDPPGHEEESLAVDEAQVARAQPAAGHEHLGRGLRVVVVALHHAGALHADLAFDPGRPLAGALVQRRQDLHRDAATRLAYRQEPAARIEPQWYAARPDGDRQGGLGQAVARRDDPLEAEHALDALV